MAVSERLQKKLLADNFPGAKSEEQYALIWFQDEDKYTVVERKKILEKEIKVKDSVTIKVPSGKWTGRVVIIGTEDECKLRLEAYERFILTENLATENSKGDDPVNDDPIAISGKVKSGGSRKRKRGLIDSDDDDETEECSLRENTMAADVLQETNRVKELLSAKNKGQNLEGESIQKLLRKIVDRFDVIESKLDSILNQRIPSVVKRTDRNECLDLTCTPIRSKSPTDQINQVSPSQMTEKSFNDDDEDFIINGINLLNDVTAKAKKPSLYATQLLSHLFTDEEMRDGCVEPRDSKGKKKVLEQEKINLIKQCISIKYGEKALKSWPEIRQSLNQKCLDKRKRYKKLEELQAEGNTETFNG